MYRKTEVKPFIDIEMKEIIYKLKFITNNRSVNSICEDLCWSAIKNDIVFDFSRHFRRSIRIGEVTYEANNNPLPLKKPSKVKTERISLQLDDSIYEIAYSVSFSIGCSVSKVVALMIEKSMNNKKILTQYIEDFISEKLNDQDHLNLMMIIEEISNTFSEDEQQFDRDEILTSLVFYVFHEIKKPEENVGNAVLQVANSWF